MNNKVCMFGFDETSGSWKPLYITGSQGRADALQVRPVTINGTTGVVDFISSDSIGVINESPLDPATNNALVTNSILFGSNGEGFSPCYVHPTNSPIILPAAVLVADSLVVKSLTYGIDTAGNRREVGAYSAGSGIISGGSQGLLTTSVLYAYDDDDGSVVQLAAYPVGNVGVAAGTDEALLVNAFTVNQNAVTGEYETQLVDNVDTVPVSGDTAPIVRGVNFIFNGVTYDHVKSLGANADAVAAPTAGIPGAVSFGYVFNGATFDRLKGFGANADAVAAPTLGIPGAVSFGYVFNGATFDRVKGFGVNANDLAAPTLGIPGSLAFLYGVNVNTGNFDRVGLEGTDTDNHIARNGGAVITAAHSHLWSENGYDRERNNHGHTHFASAARTATESGADTINYNARGGHFVIDVTAVAGAASIIVDIEAKDPVSGKYYAVLTSAAISTVSTNILKVYPGITPVANQAVSDILPRDYRVTVTHATADSITYSISDALVN